MKEARAIWQMDQRIFRAHKRGAKVSVNEHVLKGYDRPLIKDLSNTVDECREVLSTGAEVQWLKPHRFTNKVLVSLHGGPESYEGLEIRYLGLYRHLLLEGWTIAILNYRGSTKIKAKHKKNWKKSILEDFRACQKRILNFHSKPKISLLGASFGGALALLIQQYFVIYRTVLFSPLLDLATQKARAGEDYHQWFTAMFSKKDLVDFSFQNLTKLAMKRTLAICSQRDEVLGNQWNHSLQQKSCRVILQKTSHAPKTWDASIRRYHTALRWILE